MHDDRNSYYNSLTSLFFTPYILQPTRLPSKTLIDNIFFNSLEYESHSGNLLIEIADHLIQFLILDGFVHERILPKLNIFKRDFSNFVRHEFDKTISKYNWESTVDLQKKDPNLPLLDEFAPWISKHILELIKKRNHFLEKYSKEIDPIIKELFHTEYKKISNLITQKKAEGKTQYYTSFFEGNKNKSSEIWKGIRK